MKYFVFLLTLVVLLSINIISADAHHIDNTSRGSSDPKIDVNGNDAYVTWLESNSSRFGDVYFAKILDGKTIADVINITQGTSFYPRPHIHAADDNVYLLWEDRTDADGDDQIFFAKSNDGGKSFSKPKAIPENNQSVYRPFSIHQVNDIVYVFASNWNRDTQQNNIIFVTSNDFGDTFSEPIILFNHEQSDQEIQVQVHDDIIYILSDDRKNYDEKGSMYLRKILSDGTLTDLVNVNGGKTTVTYPQFAVSGENIYVSWRDRIFEKGNYGITERWYPAFVKSHDGGKSFDDPIILDSDPESVDTVNVEGRKSVFAFDNSVYILWKSEYYDGATQSFKIYLAQSDNKGQNFTTKQVSLNDKMAEHGYMVTELGDNSLHQMAITTKNPPFNDAAVYFSSMNSDTHTVPVDILKDVSTRIGWMPDFVSNGDDIYFVTEGNNNQNCILYSHSDDGGKSFSDVVNISPNGTPKTCLGIEDEIASPKKQTDLGVEIEDVRCGGERSKGYILVLQERSGSPLCVTSSSYDAMLDRKTIDEQSFEILALSAAKNYLMTHPKISTGIVEGSLELETYMTRHSIPPAFIIQGSFETTSPMYDDDADPYNHSIEITLVQNNKIHLATVDETYSLFDSDLQEERHPRLNTIVSPTLKTILSPGDRIDNKGLVPLLITEVSQGGYDKTTHWTFQSIGYQGDNKNKQWGFLPDQYRVSETVDQDGNDAIDRERMPESFGIPMPLFVFPVLCEDNKRIEGESGWHYTLPTRDDTSEVYFRSTDKGIYPDDDGIYHIQFVSMFKPEVKLLPNVEIITNETSLCPMENVRNDATHMYYVNLEYKIDDDWTTSQYPKESVTQGGIHEHATILVKVFGDEFDFTHPDFQMRDPRINFEPAESNVIHRTSETATIGLLFDTLGMHISSQCFVFNDNLKFCSNGEDELRFYVNDQKKDDLSEYVLTEDDRILISYGPENQSEIEGQLSELEFMAQYNYYSLAKLMTVNVGTVRDGTYDEDLGFETAKKIMELEMQRSEDLHMMEYKLSQKQATYDKLVEQGKEQTAIKSMSDEINGLEIQMDELFTSMTQYPTDVIFQKMGMIESENIQMYKLGSEKYQEYVDAKNILEDAIKDGYWNEKPYGEKTVIFPLLHVQINSDSKNLEITMHDDVKQDDEKIPQYELVIEDLIPDDVSWILIFSEG
ncbi:glycoside hydrolase [archaeon]|nr:glycoside hydrolase [archaeon]